MARPTTDPGFAPSLYDPGVTLLVGGAGVTSYNAPIARPAVGAGVLLPCTSLAVSLRRHGSKHPPAVDAAGARGSADGQARRAKADAGARTGDDRRDGDAEHVARNTMEASGERARGGDVRR